MLLSDVKDWLKNLNTKFDNYFIGKLDTSKDDSLGIYNLRGSGNPYIALGGLDCTGYEIKRISLLIHVDKNANNTEKKAHELFEELLELDSFMLGEYKVKFIGLLVPEPQSIGTDNNGVYEYVIEFEIYYER